MSKQPEITNDFFTDTPERIIGTETEYSVQQRHLLGLAYITALDPYALRVGAYEDYTWLTNGSKLYVDFPDEADDAPDERHVSSDGILEVATGECLSASEAARHEKAGEYLVHAIAQEIVVPQQTFPAFKRTAFECVVNSDGEVLMDRASVGHHENYTTPLFGETIGNNDITAQMLSYLATRPIWAGAGLVTQEGYQLAQKVHGMHYGTDATSMIGHGDKRALMETKAERGSPNIEVRSGDGNMSLWAIRTKLAMTSLVLRLIEHEAFPKSAMITDNATRQQLALTASDNPNQELDFDDFYGSAVDHQSNIARAAMDFAATHDVPVDEQTAALDVLATCHHIREWGNDPDALEQLSDRVDWAAKLAFIRKKLGGQSRKLTAFNLDAVRLDLLWESLGPKSPSTMHYAKHGHVFDEKELQATLLTPPNTRAATRVSLLQDTDGPAIKYAGWDNISFVDSRLKSLWLRSPYLSTSE